MVVVVARAAPRVIPPRQNFLRVLRELAGIIFTSAAFVVFVCVTDWSAYFGERTSACGRSARSD